MSWGRIDDGFYDHAKTEFLLDLDPNPDDPPSGLETIGAFWTMVSYCYRTGKNHFTTWEASGVLHRTPDRVEALLKQAVDGVPEGYKSGLILREGNAKHWEIHDLNDYRSKNEARVISGRKGGKKSGESRRSKTRSKTDFASKQTRSTPEGKCPPDPDPDPDPVNTLNANLVRSKNEANSKPPREDVKAVCRHYVKRWPDRSIQAEQDLGGQRAIRKRLAEGYTVDDLCRAIDGNLDDEYQQQRGNNSLRWVLETPERVDKYRTKPAPEPEENYPFWKDHKPL